MQNPFDERILGICGGFVCFFLNGDFFLGFLEARNWNSKSLEIAGNDHQPGDSK